MFQPCVTFNYLNTYEWFRKRPYRLEEEEHNPQDKLKAIEKNFELEDRIPIGIFYKKEKETYLDRLPHVKDKNLVTIPIDDIDLSSIMDSMT